MTDYLTVHEVLAIHEDQTERYGGAHGLRDEGQLESAVFRPQTGCYPDIVAEAAALWESLSQNHPFVDGNKRTAFAAMYTFLAINGFALTADADYAWLLATQTENSDSRSWRAGFETTYKPVRMEAGKPSLPAARSTEIGFDGLPIRATSPVRGPSSAHGLTESRPVRTRGSALPPTAPRCRRRTR